MTFKAITTFYNIEIYKIFFPSQLKFINNEDFENTKKTCVQKIDINKTPFKIIS